MRAPPRGVGMGFFEGAVPDGEWKTGFEEVIGHTGAHGAET